MAFDPITAPCDYIILGGLKSPGIAEVVGAGSPREWDVRKGLGITGAVSVFLHRDLAKFSVRLTFTEPEHWTLWEAWKPLVMAIPKRRGALGSGRDSGALDIQHPILEDLGIGAVGVVDVLQPVPDDTGGWVVEIKFIEFRRPKITMAKPDAPQATPVDPIDALEQRLLDQAQRLAADNS